MEEIQMPRLRIIYSVMPTQEILVLLCIITATALGRYESYSVKLAPNSRASELASSHGFINRGEVVPGSGLYWFEKLPTSESTEGLRKAPEVMRLKIVEPEAYDAKIYFRDPLYNESWHLNPPSAVGMNILSAWEQGFTGKGVAVINVDSEVEAKHPDLRRNFDPSMQVDISDPEDTEKCNNTLCSHGTEMAGIVGAVGNNSFCSVGIAYNVRLGNIKIGNGIKLNVNYLQLAMEVVKMINKTDIFVMGFGPLDTGNAVAYLSEEMHKSYEHAVQHGRNGLGSIILQPTGNGGRSADTCSHSEYTNRIETIAVSAVGRDGSAPAFAEPCAAVMTSAYSAGAGGNFSREESIATTTVNGECTASFSGSSSSVAVSGGVMALVLQANPELTWRDVQHLLVRGGRPRGETSISERLGDPEWTANARCIWHSPFFGFGLMDVGSLTRLAQTWTTVPEAYSCTIQGEDAKVLTDPKKVENTTLWVRDCQGIRFLEHVEVTFSAETRRRGDFELELTSPCGTKSVIMRHRPLDVLGGKFVDFTTMSVQFWEENPIGKWTFGVRNVGSFRARVRMSKWKLTLHGTQEAPRLRAGTC